MQVTSDFNINEFKVSDKFPELAKEIDFSIKDINIIRLHCQAILQPLRNIFGKISILSAKRSIKLNKAVKGYWDSDHLHSCASDIVPDESNIYTVFDFLIDPDNFMQFRQAILYIDKGFIHVSSNIPGRDYKREVLISEKGEYRHHESML